MLGCVELLDKYIV